MPMVCMGGTACVVKGKKCAIKIKIFFDLPHSLGCVVLFIWNLPCFAKMYQINVGFVDALNMHTHVLVNAQIKYCLTSVCFKKGK